MSGESASEEDEAGEELTSHIADQIGTETKRNKRSKAKVNLKRRFLQQMLLTREGREWMWDFLTRGHAFATSFVPGDPYASAFQEGERNLALYVMADIPPEAWKLMQEESGSYGK